MAAADAEGRPEAGRIAEQLQELEDAWDRLQDEMSKRRERLHGSNLAQQYYNDADEAEAWIGEQELYMIADEKAKVGGEGFQDFRRSVRRRRVLSSSSLSSSIPPGRAERRADAEASHRPQTSRGRLRRLHPEAVGPRSEDVHGGASTRVCARRSASFRMGDEA